MAGADKLIEKIIEDARQQAEAGIQRAETEAENLIRSAREESEHKKRLSADKAARDAEQRRRIRIANAELEGRKKKLRVKQEMIETAIKKAAEEISLLPPERYISFVVGLAVSSARTGLEQLILCEKDKQRFGDVIRNKVNEGLKAKGLPGGVSLSEETRDISGGCILKSGEIEVNNSIEAIIRVRRDELEAVAAKILF